MKDEKAKIEYPFHSDEFYQSWTRWKQYKKEEWRFYYKSAISEQGALDDLFKISNGDEETAIQVIGQSIAKGWKGLFIIQKTNNNGHSQYQRPARKTNEQACRELLSGGGEVPDFLKGG